MRVRLLLASVGVLGLLPDAQAQSPPGGSPTFAARAELVTVPVVVTDNYGVHFRNLKKEDFLLSEDGKPQPIVSFEEFQAPSGPPPHASTQLPEFNNHVSLEASQAPLTILVFDMVNTPIDDQSYARKELLKYLSGSGGSGQATSLLAITRHGIKVISDFTTDPKMLAVALTNMPQEPPLVEEASQEAIPKTDPKMAAILRRQREKVQQLESSERRDAVSITMLAMQQIAQYCAGLPGRKALIWATAGFPFSISEMQTVIKIVGPRSYSLADVDELYRKTWKALNQAQVAVYPVDVHGLANPTFADAAVGLPEGDFISHNVWKSSEIHGTFQEFADATGGRALYNTNDLKNSFVTAANDNRNYYMLTYRLERRGKKAGWHKLSVTVRRNGTQVRARNGFFMDEGLSGSADKLDMQVALGSPLDFTAIPVTGQWQQVTPATEPGKRKVIFLLTMPANFAQIDESDNNHFVVEFAAVARTQAGANAAEASKTMDGHLKPDTVQQIRNSGMDYRGSLILPPGQYTVHFAVQDHLSGRLGSVRASLNIQP
jgi:VWFA-related protein